jgi:hypothetical protein
MIFDSLSQDARDKINLFGVGLGQLGAGQPVNLASAKQRIEERHAKATQREMLEQSGIMERYSPTQQAILASMGPQAAMSVLMYDQFDGIPYIPKYARGTNFHPGGPAIVGEEGPEIVNLPEGAQVIPNPNTSFNDAAAQQMADLDAFKMMQQQPEYSAEPSDQKLTEGQAKTLSYLRRAMFADAAMQDPRLARAMTRMDNKIAGSLGAFGRLYTNDEYELGNLMAEQFASAILRRDSGAQTPEPEVRRYMRQFFPLPNETEEQLQAKAALRREEIRGLQMALGNASGLGTQIQEEIQQLIDASQADDGISDEDRAYLKSLGID